MIFWWRGSKVANNKCLDEIGEFKERDRTFVAYLQGCEVFFKRGMLKFRVDRCITLIGSYTEDEL